MLTEDPNQEGAGGTHSPVPIRDAAGRFLPGNPGGPGNPHVRRSRELRTAFYEAVTNDDLRAIVLELVRQARDGSIPAAKEILDRCFGKPEAVDLQERIDGLEVHLSALTVRRRPRR